jgi:hypothetical protein
MALDTVSDHVEAVLPGFLVPAATQLSWQNVAESGAPAKHERIDLVVLAVVEFVHTNCNVIYRGGSYQ